MGGSRAKATDCERLLPGMAVKTCVYYHHVIGLRHDPNRADRTPAEFYDCARRFAESYKQHPPEAEHELVVILDRGIPRPEDYHIWSGIHCRFVRHDGAPDDWSWPIQTTLANEACDFMVTFVTRAYFHRSGWLKRIVDARQKHGDGIYGSMASDVGCPLQTHPAPNPHLRGTMWAFDRATIAQYPHKIKTPQDESRLECGEWNIANWYGSIGKPAMLVTFDGEYSKPDWNKPQNTFCKGDQSNLIHWDRHTDSYRFGKPLEGPGRA